MRFSRALLLLFLLGGCPASRTTAPPAPTPAKAVSSVDAAAPGGGSVGPGDDCLRSNAALDDAHVDVAKVTGYVVARDREARSLIETFTFEGIAVTTTRSGCAHAGITLTAKGSGVGVASRDKVALARLIERLPVEDVGVFANRLKAPEACPQNRPGVEVISCQDAFITLSWTADSAALVYDFPL